MYRIYVETPDEMITVIAEFDTEDKAIDALPEDTQYCEYWIEYSGNHQRKRRMADHDSYVGKHTAIAELFTEVTEIFAEMAEALNITPEFVAEVTAPARKIAEKLTARIRARVKKEFKVPDVRIRWKYAGHFDAGIYDSPMIYDGKRVGFRVGTV